MLLEQLGTLLLIGVPLTITIIIGLRNKRV